MSREREGFLAGCRIPDFDVAIKRSADNATTVRTEGHTLNSTSMSFKSDGFPAGRHIPELDGVIERPANDVATVRTV